MLILLECIITSLIFSYRMDPPKIVNRDGDVNIKSLDNSVKNKWKWAWLDHSFKLDLPGLDAVGFIIHCSKNH